MFSEAYIDKKILDFSGIYIREGPVHIKRYQRRSENNSYFDSLGKEVLSLHTLSSNAKKFCSS